MTSKPGTGVGYLSGAAETANQGGTWDTTSLSKFTFEMKINASQVAPLPNTLAGGATLFTLLVFCGVMRRAFNQT